MIAIQAFFSVALADSSTLTQIGHYLASDQFVDDNFWQGIKDQISSAMDELVKETLLNSSTIYKNPTAREFYSNQYSFLKKGYRNFMEVEKAYRTYLACPDIHPSLPMLPLLNTSRKG